MPIERILRLLGASPASASQEEQTESVGRIVEALERLPEPEARLVACFAYILSRVAQADLNISRVEVEKIRQLVREAGKLSPQEAALVADMARHQNELFGGTEDFLVTREFRQISSPEQRRDLLNCLFAVAAADGNISAAEDSAIRQIARELLLSHKEFISIRSRYRRHLAVLKHPPQKP